ncbi:MAG: hypothetical protein V4467_00720 [Patescibacteria group bacterium]
MVLRILMDIILLAAVFALPVWLVFLVAIICLFIFDNFYECIILGVIVDVLYGVPTRFLPTPVLYSVSMSAIFILKAFLRRHLKFYGI